MSIRLASKFSWLVLAVATVVVSFAPSAQATSIHYDFTVDVTTGPLSGTTTNGSFSYDSSSITPGAYHVALGLLTALDFTFNGITYTSATANTGWLAFDAAGNLNNFAFGNSCGAGNCGVTIGTNDWFVSTNLFRYGAPNFGQVGEGSVTHALAPVNVPEPGTLGLFGLGALLLAGLFVGRRRRLG